MEFKPGQKIVFLNEKGGGVVDSITAGDKVMILDDDGFKRSYLKSQLVIVQGDSYSIDDEVVASITMQDSGINQETSNNSIRNRSNLPEINLHIEELTDSHTHLSNFEILSQQMIVFRQFFQMAKHQRKAKIVVIHGVGEGVLRYEVRSFLNKENGIEYYDGDYFEYGQGATIIEISYKS
tara:strand:- start:207 stop:746 length:540 start_codon:yes stop_codon:yes gene_type:complete